MQSIKPQMEYRQLGKSSLKVSVISYGNWLNSEFTEQSEINEKIIKRCWENGINFFDTAESYGRGEAERQLGQAIINLAIPREDLVLSTKIFFGADVTKPPNSQFLSRKHVIEGLTGSLKRLQQSYVDIVFAHRYDLFTPIEEICRAFDWCVRKGLTTYWGTSEWSAQEILSAYGVCEKFNLHFPIVEQPQYSILVRDLVDKDYNMLFEKYSMGTTVWSPLCQGLLTGVYNNGIDPNGRLGHPDKIIDNGLVNRLLRIYFGSETEKNKMLNALQELGKIAKELDCTQAQLAMAWVIKNKDVSTAITSASKESQIDDIVGAVQVYKKITAEIEERINNVFLNQPKLVTHRSQPPKALRRER